MLVSYHTARKLFLPAQTLSRIIYLHNKYNLPLVSSAFDGYLSNVRLSPIQITLLVHFLNEVFFDVQGFAYVLAPPVPSSILLNYGLLQPCSATSRKMQTLSSWACNPYFQPLETFCNNKSLRLHTDQIERAEKCENWHAFTALRNYEESGRISPSCNCSSE